MSAPTSTMCPPRLSLLNSQTIQSVDGADADLTLPAPGDTGSLGANNVIEIDTGAPP